MALMHSCFCFAVLLTVAGTACAQNIVYHVVPFTLSDQTGGVYEITGTITTNGTLGLLESSDIVDYEIEASGLYSFSPLNPAAEVSAHGGVEATANEITFVSPAGLGFLAYDNSAPNCTDCFQVVGWMYQGLTTAAFYTLHDQFDQDPSFGASALPFPIPIARVPEPDALLQMLGLFAALTVWHRRVSAPVKRSLSKRFFEA